MLLLTLLILPVLAKRRNKELRNSRYKYLVTSLDFPPKARGDDVAMDEPDGGAAAVGVDEDASDATEGEEGRHTQHCIEFRDFLIPLF